VLEHDNRELSEAKEWSPQSQEAPGLSNDFRDRIAVVGLRGGSKLTVGPSAPGWRMLPFEIDLTICQFLEIKPGSFEKETQRADPQSGAYDDESRHPARMLLIRKVISDFICQRPGGDSVATSNTL
jgi:hypothetical protein